MDGRTTVAPAIGLTGAEARRRRDEANTAVSGTSRTYATILRTDVLSSCNSILFVLGALLLALGRFDDALISVGLGLVDAPSSSATPGWRRSSARPRSC